MKKKELKKIALLGLVGGLTVLSTVEGAEDAKNKAVQTPADKKTADADAVAKEQNGGNVGYHLYTEEDLLLELDPEGVKLYQSLNDEGKALARKVASQRCNNTNDCKGLNACETDKNSCAGKGSCKYQSKCAFSDKNLAVKVVAKKMADKRSSATK